MRRFLVLALLLSTACVPADAGPPGVGDAIPDVGVRTLDGQELGLADLRGDPLLLNLWATWCPPCRAEMPYFQELSESYADRGLRVVGVSVDNAGAMELVTGFLETAGVEYDILLDPGMATMDRFGVLGLPASFLVDADGVIRHVRRGPVAEGDSAFLRQLESILPAPAP